MKTISVRDLQKNVRECVEVAQGERVVVTRRGQPAAVLVGVEGRDWEDVALQTSASFWKMIEQRRREPTIPLANARRVLDEQWKGAASPKAQKPAGKRATKPSRR
jgi:prevent-host-death family protein